MNDVKLLQQKLNDTLEGAAKLSLLLSLAEKMLSLHIENAFSYAQEAMMLATKLGDQCSIAETKRITGLCHYIKASHQEAEKYLKEAKDMYADCDNPLGVAKTCNSLGIVYIATTELNAAIAEFEIALSLYKQVGNDGDIAKVLCNLSIPYKTMGDYQKALDLLNESLALNEGRGYANLVNDKANIAGVYFHLGRMQEALDIFIECMHHYKKENNRPYYANSLMSVAGCYNKLGNYPSCLKYLQLSLREFTSLGLRRNMAGIYNDMANTLASMGGYEEAEKYSRRSLAMLEEDDNLGEMYSVALHTMGCVAIELKKYDKAEVYLLKALEIAIKKNVARVIPESYQKLADLYEAMGYPDKAQWHREQGSMVLA